MNDMARKPELTLSHKLRHPTGPRTPLVVDSPHSCRDFPPGFAPACSEEALLTSWDAWVDELFGNAPDVGAPLLSAQFPRFFLDLNRARDDIDLSLVDGDLPFAVNPTAKSAVGFGLLRKNALPDVEVYDRPISATRLMQWISTYYDPYYAALEALLEETQAQFGRVVHLDCHSMKSRGNAMNDDCGALRPDVVVSDRFGDTADPDITELVAQLFTDAGLRTAINDPYKGAELINRCGDPSNHRHSIQIELNRGLYMDEEAFEKKEKGFGALQTQVSEVLQKLVTQI